MSKLFAVNVRLISGCDLLPGKTSLVATRSNGVSLEVTSIGVIASSANSGRNVLIPHANISGMELAPNPGAPVKAKRA